MGISLESLNKSKFEEIRGNNTYDVVISNLNKIKNNKINCAIYATITSINKDDIEELLCYAKQNSFDIHFNELSVSGRAVFNKKILSLKDKENNNLEKISHYIGKHYNEKLKIAPEECWANVESLQVAANGDFYFCTEIKQKTPFLKIGNLKTFPFKRWLNEQKDLNFEMMHDCPYSVYYSQTVTFVKNTTNKCCFVHSTTNKLKTLNDIKKYLGKFLIECEEHCINCKYPDCMGYIWLLKQEKDQLLKNGIDVLNINNQINFINFLNNNQEINDVIKCKYPKCLYRSEDGKCSIQKIKPLACKLYPISLAMVGATLCWTLNLDCAYSQYLIKSGNIKVFIYNFYKFINLIDKIIYYDIIKICKEVENVTKNPDGPNKFIILKEA